MDIPCGVNERGAGENWRLAFSWNHLAMRFASTLSILAIALPALAFFPPEDSRDGVTARFVGFDETGGSSAFVPVKRAVGEPFEIRLDIANATGAPVSGGLAIWLNDDWYVAAEAASSDEGLAPGAPAPGRADLRETPLTIPPHSTYSFFATAVPRPGRVLPALYPIHASFAFPGGEPLHPIAIFEAVQARAEARRPDDGHPDAQALSCAEGQGTRSPIRLALLPA